MNDSSLLLTDRVTRAAPHDLSSPPHHRTAESPANFRTHDGLPAAPPKSKLLLNRQESCAPLSKYTDVTTKPISDQWVSLPCSFCSMLPRNVHKLHACPCKPYPRSETCGGSCNVPQAQPLCATSSARLTPGKSGPGTPELPSQGLQEGLLEEAEHLLQEQRKQQAALDFPQWSEILPHWNLPH